MLKLRKRYGASLCLSAALLALLTPMMFLLHTGHEHAHRGTAHAPNDCMTCQALLQYVSGVTLGHAPEVSAPADFAVHGCAVASIPLCENHSSPFLSRAPPPFFVSVRS